MIEPIKNMTFLDDAIDMYRKFWDEMWEGHEKKQACDFNGNLNDIQMLDYCEYEVGYPEENYETAAMIWANVVEKHTSLIWGKDKSGNIYLYSGSNEYPNFQINVTAYVLQILNAPVTQFESWSFLIEKILIEMLMSEYSIEELSGLQEIVFDYAYMGSDSYTESFLFATKELYKKKEAKLLEFKKCLNES